MEKGENLELECIPHSDIFVHVVDSPQCICGDGVEGSTHFLVNLIQRYKLSQQLTQLNSVNVNLETMFFGCTAYDYKINQ